MPLKGHKSSRRWQTSQGMFVTKLKLQDLDLTFPAYSESKYHTFSPDVMRLNKDDPLPAVDLILGTETLNKLGVVLDFDQNVIQIDGHSLPMASKQSFASKKALHAQLGELVEPESTRDATSRVTKNLDAKYSKADLNEIVSTECSHLTPHQQSTLL